MECYDSNGEIVRERDFTKEKREAEHASRPSLMESFANTWLQIEAQKSAARAGRSATSQAASPSSAPSVSTSGSSVGIPGATNVAASGSSARLPSTYAAWRCAKIEQNSYGQQVIRNECPFDAEIFWRDEKGGWSQAAIPAGNSYIGGSTATYALACQKGHFLQRQSETCKP